MGCLGLEGATRLSMRKVQQMTRQMCLNVAVEWGYFCGSQTMSVSWALVLFLFLITLEFKTYRSSSSRL